MATCGGDVVPDVSHDAILQDTLACSVEISKPVLRIGMALVSGLAIPINGLLDVFINSPAICVHPAKPVLRPGIALLGKRPPVSQRRHVVACDVGASASVEVRLKALSVDGRHDR